MYRHPQLISLLEWVITLALSITVMRGACHTPEATFHLTQGHHPSAKPLFISLDYCQGETKIIIGV